MEFTGINFVLDFLLHVAFIGVAIPVMFFTYAAELQKQILKDEVYKVVHDLLRPFMTIISYVFKDISWEVELSDSEHKQEERNALIREKVKYTLIGLFTVSLTLFFLIIIVRKESVPWDLILNNMIMTVAVVAAEIIFLYVIVKKFRPIDVEDIRKRLLTQLERAAEKEAAAAAAAK